jgi:hypothetical protein
VKVCFTGDLFLGGDIVDSSLTRYVESTAYDGADIRVANLEQPITDTPHRSEGKCTLFSGLRSLRVATGLKLDAVGLANNHIQDKGDMGIADTLQALRNAGISFFGAGVSLTEARKPYWIDDNTCIIGYCESDKPYLKKVQKASDHRPGVNPLSYDDIVSELAKLPDKTKAILHFHWGREHVALPDHDLIHLAKKLLGHEKVLCIIGMHTHRIQGIVEHNHKKAYMCLGNFLFPNFYVEPPTHIAYPEQIPDQVMTTRDYHFVGRLTYKKWRLKNRLSLMAVVDTETGTIDHVPVFQLADAPVVKELSGFRRKAVLMMVKWYSLLYRLPRPIYLVLQKADVIWTKAYRYTYAFIFLARQNGLTWAFQNAFVYLRRAS